MCAYGHGERAASHLRRAAGTRGPRTRFVVSLLAVSLVLLLDPPAAVAASGPQVVSGSGDRIYVALPDSGALAPHQPVSVFANGLELARGEVTSVFEGAIASVRLSHGRVPAGTRLDLLEVRLEPAERRAPGTLRVGLPAPARNALAPACERARLDLSALPRAYRVDATSAQSSRLLATDSASVAPAWPETLVVRWFGDRADEEIALERGELEVAVFWPGEPSARLRRNPSGFAVALGERARGVLTAAATPADTALAGRVGADLLALDAELFAGDLLPWAGPAAPATPARREPRAIRYAVDPGVPGRAAIARFLDLRRAALPRPDDRAVRIAYADAPVSARDSLQSAWRTRGVLPLFTLRCPVLCSADRASDLRELGPERFANLPACGAPERRP